MDTADRIHPDTLGRNDYERRSILLNLYNDIVARNVCAGHNAREEMATNIAYYMISNLAKEYSLRKISNALNVSVDTVSKYLDYLKEAELLHIQDYFSQSIKKRFKMNKKTYCVGSGLATEVSFMGREPGKLMENVVLTELKRRGKEIYFWKDSKQREVDMLFKVRKYELVQVSYDISRKRTLEREMTSLAAGMEELGLDQGKIITFDHQEEKTWDSKEVEIVPLWEFLLSGA